jgi:hypothetical protein
MGKYIKGLKTLLKDLFSECVWGLFVEARASQSWQFCPWCCCCGAYSAILGLPAASLVLAHFMWTVELPVDPQLWDLWRPCRSRNGLHGPLMVVGTGSSWIPMHKKKKKIKMECLSFTGYICNFHILCLQEKKGNSYKRKKKFVHKNDSPTKLTGWLFWNFK